MHIVYPAVVSALLFSIGVYGVLARRNTILVLMSVELMLNAVNLNLVAFDVWLRDRLHGGQVLTLFVIVIAAAELGVGLAIVLAVYRNRKTVDLDQLRDLAEPLPAGTSPSPAALPSATSDPPLGSSQASPAGASRRSPADGAPGSPTDQDPPSGGASSSGNGEGGAGYAVEDSVAGEHDPGRDEPARRGGAR